MDSLYSCEPVFEICDKNDWFYIIRFKDGSIPSIREAFDAIKGVEPQIVNKSPEGEKKVIEFINGIMYRGFSLNVVECSIKGRKYEFTYITNILLNKDNVLEVITAGRLRWVIENQGFGAQKRDYNIEHIFCRSSLNAQKAHYLLIQIGHVISQLLEKAYNLALEWRMSIKNVHLEIYCQFRETKISRQRVLEAIHSAVIEFANINYLENVESGLLSPPDDTDDPAA
jgi:hypothetical protein